MDEGKTTLSGDFERLNERALSLLFHSNVFAFPDGFIFELDLLVQRADVYMKLDINNLLF